MSFDRETRNKLARMVGDARRRLVSDVTDSLRRLGLQDDGTLVPLSALSGLSDADKAASEVLRDVLTHFAAQEAGTPDAARVQAAHARLVREIGFTTLNRLVALRMAEERGLIIETVRNGLSAAGFQLFERIANGSLGTRAEAYRAYVECLYDELAVDLPSLFSRTNPESLVFPSEPVLEQVLGLLNDPSLAELWKEDETIGWVYQYYNDPDERKKMRDASQAPRNSRELAVRNQFFTPRYVVKFLTDNTLGRTWYEMRQGDTRLRDECPYLVRRPTEVFVKSGESVPASSDDGADLSQDELLKQPVYITFRPKKAPRDLRILDPACGSGHFLLYAFDLLETIYMEAWADGSSPRSNATGRTLSDDYADLDELRRAVPGLVLRHNLHGVDIDPRAVQIAGLALWLRAQRSYRALGLVGDARLRLTKGNLVVAEPMPGERDLLEQFVTRLDPPLIGGLVKLVFTKMQLAGEAGTLLKIEDELRDAISSAKAVWQRGPKLQQLALMPNAVRERPEQVALELDTSGISDESFWERVEERVVTALRDFAAEATNADATKRRLFADDAERGFSFIDVCRLKFDVIVMNPPYGAFSSRTKSVLAPSYPAGTTDIYAAFIVRASDLLSASGSIGSLTDRSFLILPTFSKLRSSYLLAKHSIPIQCVADLWYGVLDGAMNRVVACTFGRSHAPLPTSIFLNLKSQDEKQSALIAAINSANSPPALDNVFVWSLETFRNLPGDRIAYWSPSTILDELRTHERLEPSLVHVKAGIQTCDDFRFVRYWFEVNQGIIASDVNGKWVRLARGGEYYPYGCDTNMVLYWSASGNEIAQFIECTIGRQASRHIQNRVYYGKPGLTFAIVSEVFYAQVLHSACVFTIIGPGVIYEGPHVFELMAYLNSSLVHYYLGLLSGGHRWDGKTVANLPAYPFLCSGNPELRSLGSRLYEIQACIAQSLETTPSFVSPSGAGLGELHSPAIDGLRTEAEAIQDRIDQLVLSAAGVDQRARLTIETYCREEGSRPFRLRNSLRDWSLEGVSRGWISYGLGCAFGRWNPELARRGVGTEAPLAPQMALPDQPPGMLRIAPDVSSGGPLRSASNDGLQEIDARLMQSASGGHAEPPMLLIEPAAVESWSTTRATRRISSPA